MTDASSSSPPSSGERRASPAAFREGFGYPFRALRFLLRQPRLWIWAAMPFALCLLLYAAIFALGWHWIGGWIEDALFEREGVWRWLGYFIWALVGIVALIVSVIAFVPIAAILASPFNDLISEKTERLYRGIALDEPFSIASLIRALRVGLAGEIRRALTLAALLLFALSLNLIPVVGQIAAAVVSTTCTIYYLSLEFTSFSMDRRYYDWTAKRGFLRRFRARSVGFGSAAFLIMMIPVVNAFFIPVSAIAGTMLFCDAELTDYPDQGRH